MNLFVWNSQGAKWDSFWTNWLLPAIALNEDLVGLLVESGWAPWVKTGDVHLNAAYPFDSNFSWFDQVGAAGSAFCTGIQGNRSRFAVWIPWVRNLTAMQTNTRCSLGGAVLLRQRNLQSLTSFESNFCIRPVNKISIGKQSNIDFTILLVHLVSGRPAKAQTELNELASNMRLMIPQGTGGIIVGDMNIDLLTTPLVAPADWRILRTNGATQQSGGELDWALLYDPNSQYVGATANVVQPFKSGNNMSDHSVMRYTIPL